MPMQHIKRLIKPFSAVFFSVAVMLSTLSRASDELPIPRFVTIKSAEANIRTGPGKRYPIKWEVSRKGVPVEIISEFEQWRKIRDSQGEEGWIFQTMLSGVRAVIIQSKSQILYKSDSASSRPLAKLNVGVIAKLKTCTKEWCNLETEDLEGWVPRSVLWGVYPSESFER